jgi:hypothetical protein
MMRTIGAFAQNAVAGQAHLPENDPGMGFNALFRNFLSG